MAAVATDCRRGTLISLLQHEPILISRASTDCNTIAESASLEAMEAAAQRNEERSDEEHEQPQRVHWVAGASDSADGCEGPAAPDPTVSCRQSNDDDRSASQQPGATPRPCERPPAEVCASGDAHRSRPHDRKQKDCPQRNGSMASELNLGAVIYETPGSRSQEGLAQTTSHYPSVGSPLPMSYYTIPPGTGHAMVAALQKCASGPVSHRRGSTFHGAAPMHQPRCSSPLRQHSLQMRNNDAGAASTGYTLGRFAVQRIRAHQRQHHLSQHESLLPSSSGTACSGDGAVGSAAGSTSSGAAAANGLSHAQHAKHLQTEQVMAKHTLKARASRYQAFIDRAFNTMETDNRESLTDGFTMVSKLMERAWDMPRIGHDLGYHLSDYMRQSGYVSLVLKYALDSDVCSDVRLAAASVLENSMSLGNREYIVGHGRLDSMMQCIVKQFGGDSYDAMRVAVSMMENMFKVSAEVCLQMLDLGALDYILSVCKLHKPEEQDSSFTLSDSECHQRVIAKKLPDWLFLLASNRDDITSYYACLAVCILASNKEAESAVSKSGTLALVEPFLQRHKPDSFLRADHKLSQGRPKEWLQKMVSLLTASRREVNALAAFHFCMEGIIKMSQDRLEVFQEIGAVSALKDLASSPSEISAKLASQALTIIGEAVPYKLSQQVPLWSVDDVAYWVAKIGFEQYVQAFRDQMVDGDLLLLLKETELSNDIGMTSSLLRKRFMRELGALKISADYSSVDPTELDSFLMSVTEELSVYTYQMLEVGVDRSMLPALTDDIMQSTCGIKNPVHRAKLLHSLQDCKTMEDMEIAVLSKQIDIFISYRRRDGNQMASLLKVLLQLRGYKVFIDVDRLYAGQFDTSLLKHIQAARHFILVLTERALDRWVGTDDVEQDWVYKEVRCALDNKKNIVPVFDANFEYPEECRMPQDMRLITKFNGIRWVHEYQEACVDKLEKFLRGEGSQTNLSSLHHVHHKRASSTGAGAQNASYGALRSAAGKPRPPPLRAQQQDDML